MKISLLFLTIFVFPCLNLFSQIINSYAKVSSLVGLNINLTNVNQTFHSFSVGEEIVLIQIQDDVIGLNTNNDASFGNISNIGNCGKYEIRRITSIDGIFTIGYTSASPTSLTVNSITNTYTFGTNSSVQIVSFQELGNPNYSTTSNLTAMNWDGNVGGVLAINVPGTLILNHSLTANGQGFRGGLVSNQNFGPICDPTNPNVFRVNDPNFGFKGEGIYKSTNTLYNNARAKVANGGGGGAYHNAGGGGGGNFSQGGIGGPGFNNCTAFPSGGFGGIDLSTSIPNRIFFGGGGGGGQRNTPTGTSGGNGGGIILIKSNEISTLSCTNVSISTNGINALNGTEEGMGGGGAGGSIVINTNLWSITGTCPLQISANGGNGGNAIANGIRGGGGAGGQGAILFVGSIPTVNTSVNTLNGLAGCNDNSVPCNTLAGGASGINNTGIFVNTFTSLPILITKFNAILSDNKVELNWTTERELNVKQFIIEKSSNGTDWTFLTKQNATINSFNSKEYKAFDLDPYYDLNYYRLISEDFDGEISSPLYALVNNLDNSKVYCYPNPNNGKFLLINLDGEISEIKIYNMLGQSIPFTINEKTKDKTEINFSEIEKGTYILSYLTYDNRLNFLKIIVEN